MDANLMATSSNDWTVRLNDLRMLGNASADSKGVDHRDGLSFAITACRLTLF